MPRSLALPRSLAVFATTVALSLTTVSAVPAHASLLANTPSLHAGFAKSAKAVHFAIRNATAAPIELRAGDSTMTVAAGQILDVNLPDGVRVVVANTTPTRQAGALVTKVSGAIKDATIVLN